MLQEAEAPKASEGALADIESRVSKRAAELPSHARSEWASSPSTRAPWKGLDSEGRLVVGPVSMRNFQWSATGCATSSFAPTAASPRSVGAARRAAHPVRNLQLERSRRSSSSTMELREVPTTWASSRNLRSHQGAASEGPGPRPYASWPRRRAVGAPGRVLARRELTGKKPPLPLPPKNPPPSRGGGAADAAHRNARHPGLGIWTAARAGDAALRRSTCRPLLARCAPSASPPPSKSRARAAANGGRRIREVCQGLPRRHHPHRPIPLRGQAASHAGFPRRRARNREEALAWRAKSPSTTRGFVARYSVKNAHPENTRMRCSGWQRSTRNRVRSDSPDDLSVGCGKPSPLQTHHRRVSELRELAGMFLYLGHALSDSNRIEEYSQQVWRSWSATTVPYPVPPDPKDPSRHHRSSPHDHRTTSGGLGNAHPTPVGFSARPCRDGQGARRSPRTAARPIRQSVPRNMRHDPAANRGGPRTAVHRRDLGAIGNWHFDQSTPTAAPTT